MIKRGFTDQQRDVQRALQGLETQFSDLRQDKGQRELGRQEIAPKRTRAKPAVRTTPSEHESQKAVIEWWGLAHKKYKLPRFALLSIPNAQILMGSARNPERVMQYLRGEGFRKGAPDLMLACGRGGLHGLFLEMKTEKGVISPEQIEFSDYLLRAMYIARICRSSEEAIAEIKAYLD